MVHVNDQNQELVGESDAHDTVGPTQQFYDRNRNLSVKWGSKTKKIEPLKRIQFLKA